MLASFCSMMNENVQLIFSRMYEILNAPAILWREDNELYLKYANILNSPERDSL